MSRLNFVTFFPVFLLIVLCSCQDKSPLLSTNHFGTEPSFVSNMELDNTTPGSPIFANKFKKDTIWISEKADTIFNLIDKDWVIGQGSEIDYLHTGKEQLFFISKINLKKRYFVITNPTLFKIQEPLVFWNQKKFNKKSTFRMLNPSNFNGLGKSYGISKIIRNKKQQRWEVLIYDCDTNRVNIYGAFSKDLIHWTPANEGNPLMTPHNFVQTTWNVADPKGKMNVTPLIGDIELHNDLYHIFCYGDDAEGHTYLGLITTQHLLNGPYTIQKQPIAKPNLAKGEESIYFPRILKRRNDWLLYYTSKNTEQKETINALKSNDLLTWKPVLENIIPRNKGWNSAYFNQQIASVSFKEDTIFAAVTGVMSYNHLNRGNVLDAALGEFVSLDSGKTFIESTNNPFIVGDITTLTQNDHLGGIFQRIKHNGKRYSFYQAKGMLHNYNCFILED